MALERLDEYVLEVDTPEAAFATINADFAAEAKRMWIWNLSADPQSESIENPAYTNNLGEHERVKGLKFANEASFTTHAEGLQTAAGDSGTAVITAFTNLLQAVGGTAVNLDTGDTADAAATTASVPVDGNGDHSADSFAGFVKANGDIECRPLISAGPHVPYILLSEAPAEDSVVYAAANCNWTDNPSAFPAAQSRLIGSETELNLDLLGMVGSLSLSEVAPNEVQTVDWSWRMGSFTRRVADTRTDPANYRPEVLAGGSFCLAKAHETVAQNFMALDFAAFSVEIGATYLAHRDAPSTLGIQGWKRDPGGRVTVSIHIPHNVLPSTAADPTSASGGLGLTDTNWDAVWETNTSDENDFQLLLQFGKTAGKIFCIWFRKLRLIGVEKVELDGIASNKLTFVRRHDDASTPPIIMAQL